MVAMRDSRKGSSRCGRRLRSTGKISRDKLSRTHLLHDTAVYLCTGWTHHRVVPVGGCMRCTHQLVRVRRTLFCVLITGMRMLWSVIMEGAPEDKGAISVFHI